MELDIRLKYGKCDMSAGHITLEIDGTAKGQTEAKKIKFHDVSALLQSLESTGNKISDKFRIALLQAILSCLKSAKSSKASICRVYISDDWLTVNASHAEGEAEGVMSLFEISRLILPDEEMISKDLQTVADDFCELLKNKKLHDIEHALKHPIFWSSFNKIRYLEMTWAKENEKDDTKRLSQRSNGTFFLEDGATGQSWTDALRIPERECEDLNIKLKRNAASSLSIDEETMINFAANVPYKKFMNGQWKPRNRIYNGGSWKEFLFFFRNVHAHFQQLDEAIRCCFNDDSEDGYWDFISRRFPGLFISVYKTYRHNVNFKCSVQPKFLPNVHDEVRPKRVVVASSALIRKYCQKKKVSRTESHKGPISGLPKIEKLDINSEVTQ